jgi:protein-S-isoprenylcysteine O-methyltransferase Ste14
LVNTEGLYLVTAAISMKASRRVGIDKSIKTRLIKEGIYKLSRNPAFVGFDLMFIDLFLAYSNIVTLTVLISCII